MFCKLTDFTFLFEKLITLTVTVTYLELKVSGVHDTVCIVFAEFIRIISF